MNTATERARIIAANRKDLENARAAVASWTEKVYTIQRNITKLEIDDAVATRREEREALEARAQADAEAAGQTQLPDA